MNGILGVDEKEVSFLEKLFEYIFEVGYLRRRFYLIIVESEEDKIDWVEIFKVCCRKVDG